MKKQPEQSGPERWSLEAMAVRTSRIHGRGLFALGELPPRRKLGELSGHLVKMPQAKKRIEAQPVIFFVELSHRLALDCSAGNKLKHVNHSCAPNCYIRIHKQAVEFYTLRTLAAGTELTVDYGLTPHKQGMNCRCGHLKCRRKI